MGLVAIALAGCGGGGADSLESDLADAVRAINEGGGQSIGGEFPDSKLNARMEGDTLVLIMSNAPMGKRTFDPNVLRKTLRPEICGSAEYRRLIEAGYKLRVEIVSNTGHRLPPVQYARC